MAGAGRCAPLRTCLPAFPEVMGRWPIGQAGIHVCRISGKLSLGVLCERERRLSADPEVISRDVDDRNAFAIMASDGLWDCISNEDSLEAVSIVHITVKKPAMCAKRLATQALTRGSSDNITVVFAFLQPVSTIERIHADRQQKYAAHQMFCRQSGA